MTAPAGVSIVQSTVSAASTAPARAPALRAEPRRFAVLTDRLPPRLRERPGPPVLERAPSGVGAALALALARRRGAWIGWAGTGRAPSPPPGYGLAQVPLDAGEAGLFERFCDRTLWPLLHAMPDRMEVDAQAWAAYAAVGARYAEVAANTVAASGLVSIHDCALVPAARQLRQLRPDLRIALFAHAPFPACDLLRMLPWHGELLEGLLACDLVGFHASAYAANFFDCAERLLGARADRERGCLAQGKRGVRVGVFPLGIDYAAAEERARRAPGLGGARDARIVLGVDPLDPTNGIAERIRAFVRLLELHPEHRERVVLVQVAEPGRRDAAESQRLKRQVDALVGEANGRLGTSRWTPIRYVCRALRPVDLAGLYREADVALVTPLRDGTGRVAKEYVASQVGDPGVLVLSRLAACAETMREALQVHPHHVDEVAESLHRALGMPASERAARMRALQRRERRHDVHACVGAFLRVAAAPAPTADAEG